MVVVAFGPAAIRRPEKRSGGGDWTNARRMQARRFANMAGVLRDLAEVRPHGASELGELDAGLAMEHWPAELAFQRADCIGQGRLGDAATPRRPGEVELVAQRQKVANLMHFHDAIPLS